MIYKQNNTRLLSLVSSTSQFGTSIRRDPLTGLVVSMELTTTIVNNDTHSGQENHSLLASVNSEVVTLLLFVVTFSQLELSILLSGICLGSRNVTVEI